MSGGNLMHMQQKHCSFGSRRTGVFFPAIHDTLLHPDTSLALLLVFSAQGKSSFRIRHDFCKLPASVLISNGLTEFNQRQLLCSTCKFGAGKWALKHHSKLLRGALASSFPFSALPCPPHPFPSPWSSLLVPALCV